MQWLIWTISEVAVSTKNTIELELTLSNICCLFKIYVKHACKEIYIQRTEVLNTE